MDINTTACPPPAPALILVSIGPVQEFIAEARKTRDLWMGSHLLSTIALDLIDLIGRANVIFPAFSATGSVDSAPNQFCALVDWDTIDTLAQRLETRRKGFLADIAQSLHALLKADLDSHFPSWDKLWGLQLEDQFNLVWVARKITNNEDLTTNYKETFRRLQQQLEERKATRTFNQWQGSHAEKCYQCGHREILGPENRQQNSRFWQAAGRRSPLRGALKEKERLCAVCLLKRVHTPSSGKKVFDSTSDLAVIPYRKKLADPALQAVKKVYFEDINALRNRLGRSIFPGIDAVDGDLFYREALQMPAIQKKYAREIDAVSKGSSTTDQLLGKLRPLAASAEQSLLKLYDACAKPSKYLAIMMLDADKMGEFMSGEKLSAGETFSPDWQRQQSGKLLTLSRKDYPALINTWGGMLVYSGGDDLLALGPLGKALETITKINAAFVKTFPTRTLSGSLVITHHQDSLRWGIEEARRSLELAKEAHDRNALVISLRLSSGTTLTSGAKWQALDASLSFYELYNHLTDWLARKDQGLASSFLYDIEKDFRAFYNALGVLDKEMLKWEVDRLLKRHIPKSSPLRDEKDSSAQTLWKAVRESIVALAVSPHKPKYNVQDNFESFLKIAAFLGREQNGGE